MISRMSRSRLVLHIGYVLNVKENLLEFPIQKFSDYSERKKMFEMWSNHYINKCIPNSSKVKLLLSYYNRHHFTERLARSKCVSSSIKFFKSQHLYLCVAQLRTFKHKKSPLFSMYVDGGMLKVLKHCRVQTYHIAYRVLSLSGDIEENPGPLH